MIYLGTISSRAARFISFIMAMRACSEAVSFEETVRFFLSIHSIIDSVIYYLFSKLHLCKLQLCLLVSLETIYFLLELTLQFDSP